MLQPFFDFVEKLATDFTWKRLVILISFVMLVGVALFLYEAMKLRQQPPNCQNMNVLLPSLKN
jgi:hypothetical protein